MCLRKITFSNFSKSVGGEQPVEVTPIFICKCLCGYVGSMGTPGQTNNDTNLKFGTHDTPLDLISKRIFFLFFRKSNPEGC